MSFILINNESLDALALELSANIGKGVDGVLQMPRIIIQSAGMERWLALKLADRLGISAGVEYSFLHGFFEEVIVAAYAREHGIDIRLLDPACLRWRLFALLGETEGEIDFKTLNDYMQGDMLKRYQLASKLAEIYDRYTLYRADWLRAWEHDGGLGYAGLNREGYWLAELWLRLKKGTDQQSVAELSDLCVAWLRQAPDFSSSPIHIFGVSSMPPLYLQLFTEVAKLIDVYFYYLEVSHEFWGLVRSEKELLRKPGSNYEEGNTLLAAFGNRNKDFFNLLTTFAADGGFIERERVVQESSSGITNSTTPLLQRLQAGIRFMENPQEQSVVQPEDRSVEFHSCYGRMRQVQALYQSLLQLFAEDEALMPNDILVLTPAINDFVPYIRAVFGGVAKSSELFIPYTVSDRAVLDYDPLCRSLLGVLHLFSGRFKVSEVWEVFSDPVMLETLPLDSADLDDISQWLGELQVHWGLDAKQRQRMSGVYSGDCTWQEAEERLLLGYATGGAGGVFTLADGRGILGVDVSGNIAAFEIWFEFLSKLFMLYELFVKVGTAAEWLVFIRRVHSEFYSGLEGQTQGLLSVIAELEDSFTQAGTEGVELSYEVFVEALSTVAQSANYGAGFIMGGVTFCQFQPMRNIPARIICMLGMDDGAFPRFFRPPAFDIAQQERRLCDPSLKLDDQGVFLETILSAWGRLLIYYSGRGLKKGEELSAALPVEMLREYIKRHYFAETGDILEQITCWHPLQSFSGQYFRSQGSGLINYSKSDYKIAQQICSGAVKSEAAYFQLPELDYGKIDVSIIDINIAELVRFFQNPCKYFLQHRCGVHYAVVRDDLPEDGERLSLDTGYKLHDLLRSILQLRLEGREHDEILGLIEAERTLPIGEYAGKYFTALYAQTDRVAEIMESALPASLQEYAGILELPVSLAEGKEPVVAELSYVLPELTVLREDNTYIAYHFSQKATWNSISEFWLTHVVYSAVVEDALDFESRLYNKSGDVELGYSRFSNEQAKKIICAYLQGYLQGQVRPLPLFRGASLNFVKQRIAPRSPKTVEQALRVAVDSYSGSGFAGGYPDNADQYVRRCFGADFTETMHDVTAFVVCAENYVQPALLYSVDKTAGKG